MSRVNVLSEKNYKIALNTYKNQDICFPLIGSVIEKKQEGVVLTNSNTKPEVFFIIHKFGFCFYYEINKHNDFDDVLLIYLMESKNIPLPDKIRWYRSPDRFHSKLRNHEIIQESERIQLRIPGEDIFENIKNESYEIDIIDENMIGELNEQFPLDLDSRFWGGKDDFSQNAFGVVVSLGGGFASICYSAAISNNIAEIDVYSKSQYRKNGLGKIAVKAFINECYRRDIIPNWDCFSNNVSSCCFAKSVGFKIINRYSFYTIFRKGK